MTLPSKMRRLALLGALSAKAEAKQVTVVTGAEKASGKTKQVSWLAGNKTLLLVTKEQNKFKQAVKNLDQISLATVGGLSAYSILTAKRLVTTKETLAELKKTYAT